MTEIRRPNIYPPYCNKCQEASSRMWDAATHARNQIPGAEIRIINIKCEEAGTTRRKSNIKRSINYLIVAHPSENVGGAKTFEGDPKDVECLYLKKFRGIFE